MTQYITFLDEPEETHRPHSLSATTSVIRNVSFTTPPRVTVTSQEVVWMDCPHNEYRQEIHTPDSGYVDWLGFDHRPAEIPRPERNLVQCDDYIMKSIREGHDIHTRHLRVERDPIAEKMKMRFVFVGDKHVIYPPQLTEHVRHYRDEFLFDPSKAITV